MYVFVDPCCSAVMYRYVSCSLHNIKGGVHVQNLLFQKSKCALGVGDKQDNNTELKRLFTRAVSLTANSLLVQSQQSQSIT